MTAGLAIIIYGGLAIGYLALLMLTENSACHYMDGRTPRGHGRTILVVVPAERPVPARRRANAVLPVRVRS